jgi:hypothetical protein
VVDGLVVRHRPRVPRRCDCLPDRQG